MTEFLITVAVVFCYAVGAGISWTICQHIDEDDTLSAFIHAASWPASLLLLCIFGPIILTAVGAARIVTRLSPRTRRQRRTRRAAERAKRIAQLEKELLP